jgi:uncharacterized alpha-E superfamily protein
MLLSRVGGNLYWAARYLERAASTARIVREHTNMIIDMPIDDSVTWEPLLSISGENTSYGAVHERHDEASVIKWVVSEQSNPSAIVNSVDAARDNLRSSREVIPTQLWATVNDLHLYVSAHLDEAVDRTGRSRFCDRLIGDVQQSWGIVEDSMRRDEANALLALGRFVERADMTTRVLDVRAVGLLGEGVDTPHVNLQWAGVLRSMSALQMYHRAVQSPVHGPDVIAFLLGDEACPRSVRHNLAQLERITATLPRSSRPLQACAHARAVLSSRWGQLTGTDLGELRDGLDAVQVAVAQVSDAIVGTFVFPDS